VTSTERSKLVGASSAIEWTEATWNPVAGCSKISPGCAHCYAERLSLRFGRSTKAWTPANAAENVVLYHGRLGQPSRWRRPRMIFVNSMSDLFHELVPFEFIDLVFEEMASANHHTYQVLTKRPERALEYMQGAGCPHTDPLPNVWLGVSIENSRFTWRAEILREVPAAIRFVSAEPLLGSLFESGERRLGSVRGKAPLDVRGIDWLIAGGESGIKYRPVDVRWVRELRDECRAASVAFFFKQWGGRTPKAGGRELDGLTHDGMPAVIAA
jgi:protein gp37